MFTYRNANHVDFPIIASFPQNNTEAFYMFPKGGYPVNSEKLYEVSQTRHLPTVIEHEGEIAGYSNLYDLAEGEHGWLGNVIINPGYRGKGAARFLLETMIIRARTELKLQELRLVCHNTNTKALLLYYKTGFKPFDLKEANDRDNNKLAGILMKKPLLLTEE